MRYPRRNSVDLLARQGLLPFDVPRFDGNSANDDIFKTEPEVAKPNTQSSWNIESLADEIQAADRMRLLEPTSLPKVLRGHKRRPRPQTAIIAYAAQRAYERRIGQESVGIVVKRFVSAHEQMLNRIARKMRFR